MDKEAWISVGIVYGIAIGILVVIFLLDFYMDKLGGPRRSTEHQFFAFGLIQRAFRNLKSKF